MSYRLAASLLLLTAAACGSDAPPPPAIPADGPLAMLVIEAEGQAPLEVKGPRPGELKPDRRGVRGDVWRLSTLYGNRIDVADAVLDAVLEGGARVGFTSVARTSVVGSELVVLRDPRGIWHVVFDPAPAAPVAEAHGVTGLRLRVSAATNRTDHGAGAGRGTGGGRGGGQGGGAMDGSGGMRGGR